ncbi:MAG: hypothetical protein GF307_15160, partial [candidate division Zixibacteria bacterium]|nr:hypothetical protein [candidate division Zixibacteria bacterium]
MLTAPALIGAEYSLSPSDYAIIEPGIGHGEEGGQRILLKYDLPEGINNQPITRAYIRFAFNFPVGDNTASTEFRVYS